MKTLPEVGDKVAFIIGATYDARDWQSLTHHRDSRVRHVTHVRYDPEFEFEIMAINKKIKIQTDDGFMLLDKYNFNQVIPHKYLNSYRRIITFNDPEAIRDAEQRMVEVVEQSRLKAIGELSTKLEQIKGEGWWKDGVVA